jgi:hypothetical protein
LSTASNDRMAVNNELEKFDGRRYSIIWLRGLRKNQENPRNSRCPGRVSNRAPTEQKSETLTLERGCPISGVQVHFKNRETRLGSWVSSQKHLRYLLGERSVLEPISSSLSFANTPRLDLPASFPFCPVTTLFDFIYSQSHQHFF